MEYQVLGPLQLLSRGDTIPVCGGKQRTLLALLLIHRGNPVPTRKLVWALSADDVEPASRHRLQVQITELRHLLTDDPAGQQPIERASDGYTLTADSSQVDSARFENAVRQTSASGGLSRRLESLNLALSYWYGQAYEGLDDHPEIHGEGMRLDELRQSTLEMRAETMLGLGLHRDLVPDLKRLVVDYPYRESFWSALMVSLYRSNRAAESLRTFGQLQAMLRSEAHMAPNPAIVRLADRIRDRDSELDWAPNRRQHELSL